MVDNGREVTINDSYKNVSLVRKVDAIDCAVGGNFFDRHAEVPAQLGDIIAFSAKNMSVYYIPFQFEGGNGLYWNTRAGDYDFNTRKPTFSRGEGTYYIFRWQTTSEKNGLEVFNSAGEQIFNSNLKYLRIIDVIKENVNNANWGTRSYGHKIGIVACSMPVKFDNYGDRTGAGGAIAVYFPNQNSFRLGNPYGPEWGPTGGRPDGDWRGEIYLLVIDLDGID